MSILLVAHVDTVFNRGEAAKRPFKVDENGFAWGPGVGDDKATVVEVIYGLKALLKAGFSDFKEIIYYTNGEEGGSRLPKRLWQSFLLAGRFCRYYGRSPSQLGHRYTA